MVSTLVTRLAVILHVASRVTCQDIEVLSHICKYGVHADGIRYHIIFISLVISHLLH